MMMASLSKSFRKKEKEEVLKKIKEKHIGLRLFQLLISLLISSFLFNLFLLKFNIVTGGVNGIAVIMNRLCLVEPSIIIFITSFFLFLASYFFLGFEESIGAVFSTFIYPILVKVTSFFTTGMVLEQNDLLLISIYIGIIGGIANGLMYKSGFSNGGLPIISQILYKKFRIATSKSSFFLNGVIVILGGFLFSWTKVLYAFIILYINSFMIEKIVIGVSKKKAFYIITKEEYQIEEYILKKLKHGVTIIDVKNGLSRRSGKMILTVIPTKDYTKLKKAIKCIDSNSFFLVCDAYQCEGGK